LINGADRASFESAISVWCPADPTRPRILAPCRGLNPLTRPPAFPRPGSTDAAI
jgi:hypothetical protein